MQSFWIIREQILFLFCLEWPTTPGELEALFSVVLCVFIRNWNAAAFRKSSAPWKIEPLWFNSVIFIVPPHNIPLTTSHWIYSIVIEISWCTIFLLELSLSLWKSMGERNWMVNLLGTNFGSFAPADVVKSVWFFQTVSFFSKDLMTVLFIYYFSFYVNIGILSLFFSSAAINMEEGFLDCISVMVISFFFCFCSPPLPHVLFGR